MRLTAVVGSWSQWLNTSSSLEESQALAYFVTRGVRDVFFRLLYELSYITMIRSIVIALLVLASLTSGNQSNCHEELQAICEKIGDRLQSVQNEMKRETEQMNKILTAGHIQIKDPYKAKPQEMNKISRKIQALAKDMQKIYDDKDYLRFCVIFHEEKQYKEHNSTQIKQASSKLKKILGEQVQDL